MQQNFCIRPRRQGSITLFLALILTLVFSLFFSLLEAARVQALSQIAKRSLWLEMESAFGEGNCHILSIRPVGGTEIA